MTLETPLLPLGDPGEDDSCSISYFRTMLATETRRMTELCDDWERKLEKNKEIISDVTEVELQIILRKLFLK
jgi:hypothetical protein